MDYIKKLQKFIMLAKCIFVNWRIFNSNRYIVEILRLSYNKTLHDFIVEYHLVNKRIHSEIALQDFIESPLLYAVHPKQIYLLGLGEGKMISRTSSRIINEKQQPNRRNNLNRVLYNENTIKS